MTDMNFLVRHAEKSDIPALYSLKAALGYGKDPGYFERCLEEQDLNKRAVLVAARDAGLLGWGMLNWQPQYPLYKRLNIPEIQDLNVIPSARRQGVATAIIQKCEDLARAQNHTQTGISVGLYADYGAAQRLYVRLGYIPDGYGVTYDRVAVTPGEIRPIDDNLCLMMVKEL